mgnify:CR=1 FL=1
MINKLLINEDRQVWLRLGVSVILDKRLQDFANEQEFHNAVVAALSQRKFEIDGDTYIPNFEDYAEKFKFENNLNDEYQVDTSNIF